MKTLVKALLSLLLLNSALHSAYHAKGMEVYKKMCSKCHGGPFRGAKMHTTAEWEDIRDASKTPTLTLHKGHPEALEALDRGYFSNKREQALYKFLIGNAKDSGAVPGCDANYCGSSKQ
ncbi:MAG: hypothetical protein PHI89_02770 [Thiovulaceae bacterium]|jgi:hypothetical protein|nr:hypothetical protein [Sulfurimonadaceae bacterium]MDD3816987.1 hypothetical protein [Sulfurimonadaceae bacterium]